MEYIAEFKYDGSMQRSLLFVTFLIVILGMPPSTLSGSNSEIFYSNQKVSDRFEENINKLAAIMDELRYRQNITETRVAYGGVDTPIEQADYWVNFAAEAIAYQRVQNYNSASSLRGSLEVLKLKVLRAKTEVKQALNYEK